MEKPFKFELKKIQQYVVDVTLDPDTANSKLLLSDDQKQVSHEGKRQILPDNPERFDRFPGVLGKVGFSRRKFYYEVLVSGKTKWMLGVAQESINRKGRITACPENGYWTVCLRNKTKYEACESPHVPLHLKQAPQKIGVFVNYEEGVISFYDVDAMSHIYSFTRQCFTHKLYPIFCPFLNDGGRNSAPLIITPVEQSE